MSVKRQTNGRYKVVVDVGGRGADRRRITRMVDDEAAGYALEAQLRRRPADAHRRTVLDAVDRFLELKGRAKAPNTENQYRSTRDTWIAGSWLGRIELDRLDADDLERYYAQMFAGTAKPGVGPRSRSTVVKVHRLVSVALRDAKRARWVPTNVARDAVVEGGPPPKPSAADDYDLADVARVLDAAGELSSSPHAGGANAERVVELGVELVELAQFTLATGARAGEIAGLRWRDVELVDGVVAFHGSITRKRRIDGRGWERKATKTGKPRKLKVDEACRAMLEARYARQYDQAVDAGLDADDLERRAVWSLELERDYTSPSAIGARWRRAKNKTDVALRFHDLRHVNASEMTAAGVPVTMATRRTGHASNRMFHDVYSHHRAGDDDQAVDALGETWSNITAKRKAPR